MKLLRSTALAVLLAVGAFSTVVAPVAYAQGGIFGVEARASNFVLTEQQNAAAHNAAVSLHFANSLDAWKQATIWNRGQGKPAPEKPEVPMLHTVDTDLARQRFTEWWNIPEFTPGVVPQRDFIIQTPLPLAPDTWETEDKPLAQPADPVAGPDGDIPGQYLVAVGDKNPAGAVIRHPKYGRLTKYERKSPFGSVVRWVSVQ